MIDIKAEDCRIEGFRSGRSARYYKATHLPTGVSVSLEYGTPNKRVAMNALQSAVTVHETQALSQQERKTP